MEHGKTIRCTNQFPVQIEEIIEARIGFALVDGSRHQEVGGVMVAFRFDKAGVELGQLWIDRFKFGRQDLEFFTASSFDQRAANEMIDGLVTLTVANCAD